MSPPPDFSSLSSAEKDVLIASLVARLSALEAENTALRAENAALREKLKLPPKTPDNSSTPPSRGHKANAQSAPKPKRKPHPGAARALHPDPTRIIEQRARHCPHCAADVSGVAQARVHDYDRIEIAAISPDVTRVRLWGGTCACCAKAFKAPPPEGLEPGSPFGPNLRAFLIYLRFAHAVSFERLARLAGDLLGLEISEGALVNILNEARPAFARAFSAIRTRLLASPVVCSDETSVRVGKKTWWTWSFHHGDSACFVIDPHRSRAVVEAFLGGHRPPFWVSDRYGAQMGWAKDHQVCLAHLIRDATYAIEAGDSAFAPHLRKLLRRACAIAHRRPDLADATLRQYAYALERKLDTLLRIAPRHAAAAKLQKVIKSCRANLFVFLRNRNVPPTNNGSEQALRPCVVFRKVTNCFRSTWAAELYAHIRSLIETARRRRLPILNAIRLTLNNQPIFDTG